VDDCTRLKAPSDSFRRVGKNLLITVGAAGLVTLPLPFPLPLLADQEGVGFAGLYASSLDVKGEAGRPSPGKRRGLSNHTPQLLEGSPTEGLSLSLSHKCRVRFFDCLIFCLSHLPASTLLAALLSLSSSPFFFQRRSHLRFMHTSNIAWEGYTM
jgi:hypothetical protein